VDYVSASHALFMMQDRFSPGRIFTKRGEYYNIILASIRRLLASTWEEILQHHIAINHGNIWITNQSMFDRFYNLLVRLQAAIKYSRGIKIEMKLDPMGQLRLGDPNYWQDNICTIFETMKILKGCYNLRIRSTEDHLDQKRIYVKPLMVGKEFKSGHSKDPMSPFYEYCKSLGQRGSCIRCKRIKVNKSIFSCILLNMIATTSSEQQEDLAFFEEKTLETLMQFGLTGDINKIDSILHNSRTPQKQGYFWDYGYQFTTDVMLDHQVDQEHLEITKHQKRFCTEIPEEEWEDVE